MQRDGQEASYYLWDPAASHKKESAEDNEMARRPVYQNRSWLYIDNEMARRPAVIGMESIIWPGGQLRTSGAGCM